MTYIYNPKLEGSNLLGCVPQNGKCPHTCKDCFAYRPGAYLGENGERCPNIPPTAITKGKIVRINDINDSNNKRKLVINTAKQLRDFFFNTCIPMNLDEFPGPVVLTANPGDMTDNNFWVLDEEVPINLMCARARVNSWNLDNVDNIVNHYTTNGVPVVLTFMAYYDTPIPEEHKKFYEFKQRTWNSYWCLKADKWYSIKDRYKGIPLVYTCGAGPHQHLCKDCGTCERLYYESKARIQPA